MKLMHDKQNLTFAPAETSNTLGNEFVACPLFPWTQIFDAAYHAQIYQFAYERAVRQVRSAENERLQPAFDPSWN